MVLLLGAAILILLIACANLANVTLSRSMGRRTEMAVRAALGAGRARIARQLLTESVMLSVAGGVLGLVLAAVATRALLALNPHALPGVFTVGIDGQVFSSARPFPSVRACSSGLRRRSPRRARTCTGRSKDRARGGTGGRASERLRRGLVVAQVSLAVMLLVGAGLLVRSFHEITTVRLGYDPTHVITAQLRVDGARYDSSSAVNSSTTPCSARSRTRPAWSRRARRCTYRRRASSSARCSPRANRRTRPARPTSATRWCAATGPTR